MGEGGDDVGKAALGLKPRGRLPGLQRRLRLRGRGGLFEALKKLGLKKRRGRS